ncbi:MAG: hypothetical protein KI786_15090 [Mameliella sp.]|nr:hypothetical protein [Phaeodactylibacter sp.]
MLPPGRDDLNRDGNDDIVVISVDSFKVYSPFTQSFLSRIAIPANLQAAYGSDSPRFITFADMCGAPGKRHAIVGKPKNGNPNTPINKLDNFAVFQMTTAGGGLGWVQDTMFFVDDMILNSGGNPENWKLRAIADMDNDGEEEIVMQNVNSRRIALIGLGEEGGFTSGPINGIVGENQVADSPTGSYSLILKLESDPETEAFLVDRNLYRESEFDLNDNGTPDLLTWQEAEGDTSAFGCKVFDLEQNELIWSFDFPADQLQGGLRKFHGFHDVNADGQKEIFLGGFTVVTQDGTMHMPFSEDFRILTIRDMDDDGFPDVLGVTPDDRIQVWGAGAISNVKETRFREGFSAMAFPNPALGVAPQLELSLVAGGAYTVTLHDLYGRQLRHKDLGQLSAGDHQISLSDWNSLNSGTYCLIVRGPSGERTLLIQFVE